MKLGILVISIVLFYSTATGQSTEGIQFRIAFNWDSVLQVAKKEGKFIFVDCFATWCSPCKAMDKNIYTSKKVGDFFNEKFISVKVQMDTAINDNSDTRRWYTDARNIGLSNHVIIYPSFLFFSPDGKIVTKGVGYKNADDFIKLAQSALDTQTQYYTLLEKFKMGQLNFDQMAILAMKAKLIREDQQAKAIADYYETNYLFRLNDTQLFVPANLSFIEAFINQTDSPDFRFFWNHRKRINTILGADSAEKKIVSVIAKSVEKSTPFHQQNINWISLESSFQKRFGKLGKLAVLQQEFYYFFHAKNWPAFGKAYKKYYDNIGTLNIWNINNFSWEIFENVPDKDVLAIAIKTMEPHREEDINSMDTYANLLYKYGDKTKAIEWEQKAVEKENFNAAKENRKVDPSYIETLKKMRDSVPTWK